jgi:hypothetical protein
MMYFWGRSTDHKTICWKQVQKSVSSMKFKLKNLPKLRFVKKKKLLSPPKFYLPFRIWDSFLVMRRYQSTWCQILIWHRDLKVNFKLSKNLNSVPWKHTRQAYQIWPQLFQLMGRSLTTLTQFFPNIDHLPTPVPVDIVERNSFTVIRGHLHPVDISFTNLPTLSC